MPRRVLVVDDQQPHGPLNRGQRRLLRRQIVARPERFELPTLCFEGRCSIQLSYGRAACFIDVLRGVLLVPSSELQLGYRSSSQLRSILTRF